MSFFEPLLQPLSKRLFQPLFNTAGGVFDPLKYNPLVYSCAEETDRPLQPGHVLTGNGVDTSIDCGTLDLNGSAELTVEGYFKDIGGSGYAFELADDLAGVAIFMWFDQNGDLIVFAEDGTNLPTVMNLGSQTGLGWLQFKLELNSTALSVTIGDNTPVTSPAPYILNGVCTLTLFNSSLGSVPWNGAVSDIKFSLDGATHRWYKLDESAGTAAYDSSGFEAHGSLLGVFSWTVDTTKPFDHHNQSGYTDNAGVLIPRDESNTSLDVLGNPLQWSGRAYPVPPKKRQSHCGTFDGVGDRVVTPLYISNQGVFEVSVRFQTAPFETGYLFFQGSSPNPLDVSIRALFDTGSLVFNVGNVGIQVGIQNEWADNEWHQFKLVSDGVTATGYVNGILVGSIGIGAEPPVEDRFPFVLGARYDSSQTAFAAFLAGQLADFQIDTRMHLPLAEGAGTTIYDTSGNGNHGTLTTASEAAFWAGRQDEYHANIERGFTLSGAVKIPAREDGLDALGGPLTNPPVECGHNGAETQFDLLNLAEGDLPPPELAQAGPVPPPSDYEFGDSVFPPTYKRILSEIAEDQFLVYSEPLSGSFLSELLESLSAIAAVPSTSVFQWEIGDSLLNASGQVAQVGDEVDVLVNASPGGTGTVNAAGASMRPTLTAKGALEFGPADELAGFVPGLSTLSSATVVVVCEDDTPWGVDSDGPLKMEFMSSMGVNMIFPTTNRIPYVGEVAHFRRGSDRSYVTGVDTQAGRPYTAFIEIQAEPQCFIDGAKATMDNQVGPVWSPVDAGLDGNWEFGSDRVLGIYVYDRLLTSSEKLQLLAHTLLYRIPYQL